MFCYGYVFSQLTIECIASDFFGIPLRLGDGTLPAAIGLIENLDQLVLALLAIAQIRERAVHKIIDQCLIIDSCCGEEVYTLHHRRIPGAHWHHQCACWGRRLNELPALEAEDN